MRSFIRQDVEAAVARTFPEHLHAEALGYLDFYGSEPHERERERVQVAIVILSHGDLGRLAHFVDAARMDYRDVLYWSESSS
jgi:hypothetical protein